MSSLRLTTNWIGRSFKRMNQIKKIQVSDSYRFFSSDEPRVTVSIGGRDGVP